MGIHVCPGDYIIGKTCIRWLPLVECVLQVPWTIWFLSDHGKLEVSSRRWFISTGRVLHVSSEPYVMGEACTRQCSS